MSNTYRFNYVTIIYNYVVLGQRVIHLPGVCSLSQPWQPQLRTGRNTHCEIKYSNYFGLFLTIYNYLSKMCFDKLSQM